MTETRTRIPSTRRLLPTPPLTRTLMLMATLTGVACLTPAMARGQITSSAYVPSASDGLVTIVDTATHAAFPIAVSGGPLGVAFTPDGRRAYVTRQFDPTVAVIDVATNAPVGAPIPIAGPSAGIAITPDGRYAYVNVRGPNQVDVIDLATNTVTTSIPLPNPPSQIAITPDGQRAYVLNQALGKLFVIDTAANTLLVTIQLTFTPLGIAAAPDGQRVYIGNPTQMRIVPLDVATNTLGPAIHNFGPFGPMVSLSDLTIAPDGRMLYVAITDPSFPGISAIDLTLPTPAPVWSLNFGANPSGIAITSDGSSVYLSGGWPNKVSIIDTAFQSVSSVDAQHPTAFGTFVSPNMIAPALTPLEIAGDADLPALGFRPFVIFNGGTLKLQGDWSTSRSLSMLHYGGRIDTNGFTATLAGNQINDGVLTKIGRGTLVIAGPSTHAGGSIVSSGTLEVNGTHLVPMLVDGGMLSGTGTLGTIDAEWGTINPGSGNTGPGILHATQATLQADTTFVAQLNGPAAGAGYDQLAVSGTATINNAMLTVQLGSGYTPAPGAVFTILTHATGTFAGLPEGALIFVGPQTFRITYHGGASASDVVLIANSAPTITGLGDRTIAENGTLGPLAFTVGDDITPAAALAISATSSNGSLLPDANLSIGGGNGAARTLMATPVAGASGWTMITVTVSDGALIAQQTFRLTVTPAPPTPPNPTYYLAEGATGPFFDTDILIANPNNAVAPFMISFFTDQGTSVVQQRTLLPMSRLTIRVDEIPGLEATNMSTTVTSTSGLPLIVERTMRWDASGYGAHTEKASAGPAPAWYFAEGSQGFFSTYFLLLNPASTPNIAHVTYFRENGPAIQRDYAIGAAARRTVDVSTEPALMNQSFGALVTFDQPGMAERAMYFGAHPLFSGGTAAAGVTALAKTWFLAEGATGSFFTTFVLIANPGDLDASVEMTYLPADGVPVVKTHVVGAHQRLTINIAVEDPALASAAVSTRVIADRPVVVERSQYWPNPAPAWYEAHSSAGETTTAKKWGLAEGRVGGADGAQTFVLIANPGATAAQITATFLRTDGTTVVKTFVVEPTSRFNIGINGPGGDVPELSNESFGTIVESTQPVIVERALYWDANGVVWAAGTGATATPLP
jgi:YVTN family beta-propeller protein/autotransporter-associated beta strand protein